MFFPAEAASLVAHLGGAYLAQQTYRDGKYVWEKLDEFPEVLFLDTSAFLPEPEPMEKLRLEAASATKNWLDYYHKNVELAKEVASLKSKLTSIQQATGGTTA